MSYLIGAIDFVINQNILQINWNKYNVLSDLASNYKYIQRGYRKYTS
jgi:hypothetical protein